MKIFTLLIFLLITQFAQAQQGFISVDRDSISVGDFLTLSIVINHDNETALIYPDSADFGDDFEFLSRETIRTAQRDSAIYRLQFFGDEKSRVPELKVGQLQNGDTNFIALPDYPLVFLSTLESEDSPFRPMKPLYAFAISIWPFILLGLLLIALAGGGYYYLKNRPEPPVREIIPRPEPAPFHDPLKELEEELNRIHKQYPIPSENYKLWFSALGDAIRRYFEDMYSIPALESTTRELMGHLARNIVDQELTEYARKILQMGDMVKFAKLSPALEQEKIIQETATSFLNHAKHVDQSKVDLRRERYLLEVARHNEEQNKTEEVSS